MFLFLFTGRRTSGKRHQVSRNGNPKTLSCARKSVFASGHTLWKHRNVDDSFTIDAWWSIPARRVWKCLISDTLTLGGEADGGLTPPSGNQGAIRYHVRPQAHLISERVGRILLRGEYQPIHTRWPFVQSSDTQYRRRTFLSQPNPYPLHPMVNFSRFR